MDEDPPLTMEEASSRHHELSNAYLNSSQLGGVQLLWLRKGSTAEFFFALFWAIFG